MKKVFGVFFLLALSGAAFSSDNSYFTIGKVVVEQVNLPTEMAKAGDATYSESMGEVIAVYDSIVALGEKIYPLIEKGRPVWKLEYAPISVLPSIDGKPANPMEMSGWNIPQSRSYRVSYINLYQMTVVDFAYTVHFTTGGSLDGKGLYLTGVQVVPETLHLAWGFSFSATSKLVQIQNHGTKDDPVAGLNVMLSYTVDTVLKHTEENLVFFVRGDGSFKAL